MTKKITLNVTGMKCGGCEQTVSDKILQIEGVTTVQANHVNNSISIVCENSQFDISKIKQAIINAGFTVCE